MPQTSNCVACLPTFIDIEQPASYWLHCHNNNTHQHVKQLLYL